MMPENSRRLWQFPLALAGAIAVTAVCVCLIAMLNVAAVAELPRDVAIRSVVIEGPESDLIQRHEREPEPEPELPETEIMTVDLDMPEVDAIEPEPLDLRLDLPTPEVNPIQVTVRRPVARPSPPRPRPAPKPVEQKKAARPAVHRAERVDEPPREFGGNVKPVYPTREERLGIEDTVRARLLIDQSGRVEDVQFLSGGEAFRQAVREAAADWRFSPARHYGQPVTVWGIKEVRFTNRRGGR